MDGQGKVLVIDDDRATLRLLQEATCKAGFQVVTVANGIDGLQELYARQPDLVILDVMMPRMDGWETLTRIRQISSVPVIMLTAKDTESDKLRGFKLGVDDYIQAIQFLRTFSACQSDHDPHSNKWYSA